MRHLTKAMALAITVIPMTIRAQAQTGAQATAQSQSQAQAQAQAQLQAQGQATLQIPASFSAEHKSQLSAMYTDARTHGMSDVAISNRVAEGLAKGASESSIMTSATTYHSQLQVTQQALIHAGRANPQSDEVERGANAMARGLTSVQIEGIAKKAPSDRSLVVAFEVLTDLAARGVPVANAVAQIQTKIEQRATDASLREFGASLGASLGVRAGGARGNPPPAMPAAASPASSPASSPTAGAKGAGVGAIVGATVGGVIRRP